MSGGITQLFYLSELSAKEVTLGEEESGHVIRVLRLREDDPIWLVDGKGTLAEAAILTPHPKKCVVRITSVTSHFEKRNYRFHLAVAPTKNSDRMEWLVEKATETGLDEFTPLLCRHSERRQFQTARLQKVAVSAMKQSLKAYLPVIGDLVAFEKFVSQPLPGEKFIAHCRSGEKPHLFNCITPGEEVVVLIGPEGDFSPEEISLALQNGFQEISLGSSRLRTETAALSACFIAAVKNEAQTTSDSIFAQ